MNKRLLLGIMLLILVSCSEKRKSDAAENSKNDFTQSKMTSLKNPNQSTDFEFDKFVIAKGRLGSIKIGMTIQEAEMQFSGLEKKIDEATNFGFCGGSPAYLYSLGDEQVFGLIPKLDTDTLLIILAFSEKLCTSNGLNPKSNVSDLLQQYPKLTVKQDLMNGWEFFEDKKNNWGFIFITDEKNQIGVYPKIGATSKPKLVSTKADWITIE